MTRRRRAHVEAGRALFIESGVAAPVCALRRDAGALDGRHYSRAGNLSIYRRAGRRPMAALPRAAEELINMPGACLKCAIVGMGQRLRK